MRRTHAPCDLWCRRFDAVRSTLLDLAQLITSVGDRAQVVHCHRMFGNTTPSNVSGACHCTRANQLNGGATCGAHAQCGAAKGVSLVWVATHPQKNAQLSYVIIRFSTLRRCTREQ